MSDWRAHPKQAPLIGAIATGTEDGSADLTPFGWHTPGTDILTKVSRGGAALY